MIRARALRGARQGNSMEIWRSAHTHPVNAPCSLEYRLTSATISRSNRYGKSVRVLSVLSVMSANFFKTDVNFVPPKKVSPIERQSVATCIEVVSNLGINAWNKVPILRFQSPQEKRKLVPTLTPQSRRSQHRSTNSIFSGSETAAGFPECERSDQRWYSGAR